MTEITKLMIKSNFYLGLLSNLKFSILVVPLWIPSVQQFANNMEIAAILQQPGSGWSMETASSSVLKAQKEREREWPLLKLEAPLHSGKLTYLLISAKVQQVSNM